jgi:hypothetical protein
MGNALLMSNNDAFTDYAPYFDGFMVEGWCHAKWDNGWPAWRNETSWLAEVGELSNPAYDHKAYIAFASSYGTQRNENEFLFCFASYLLGKNDTVDSFFGYNTGDPEYNGAAYHPEFDVDLGEPLGPYVYDQSLYQRQYERGLVAANLTNFNLGLDVPDGVYEDLYGAPVNFVTLSNHRGTVLVTIPDTTAPGQISDLTAE